MKDDEGVSGMSADDTAAQHGRPADEADLPLIDMLRPRWGDPEDPGHLPDAAMTLLGLDEPPQTQWSADDVRLPESLFPEAVRRELETIVGIDHIDDRRQSRIDHTRGFSTPDLLRLRDGDGLDAPDLVVTPADHYEVLDVLDTCAEHRIAVVPFTGGTSVVGGLAPARDGYAGVVCVDTGRLGGLIELDETSRVARLGAGLRGVLAEELLRERGYTLGHFPQSYEGAGIGGYAATRSAGQASAGYGRFDEMVEGLVLATPSGTVTVGRAPKSAAGPDLRALVLGSEGAFGIITEVTVRVRPRPQARVFEGWRFESFEAGVDALRALAQDGPTPTVLRLSDEVETAINLSDPEQLGGSATGVSAIVGFEGTESGVAHRHADAGEVLRSHGGASQGAGPGESWRQGRFRGPYLRDPLLDAGVLVETLETVTYWSGLHELRAAVTDALTDTLTGLGAPPLVMCHISHVYPAGASLYFTVACPGAGPDNATMLEIWTKAKAAANAAIGAHGGSITHHHGVGADHREAYHREVGELALRALRAVKQQWDPTGVCNPGILL